MADDNRKKLGKVIARAWVDKEYHARLLKDPHAVLTEAGIDVKGTVHVHENTDSDVHLVLPKRPAGLEEHIKKHKEAPGTCSSDPMLCSTLTPELCSTLAEKATPDLCSTI